MPTHDGAHDLDADSSATPQRLTAFVRGRVQGVGYRDFCRRAARTIARDLDTPLTGYARNLPDGNVEVVAEGPRPACELLLEQLRDGPGFAQILDVRAGWSAPSHEFDSFTIRY